MENTNFEYEQMLAKTDQSKDEISYLENERNDLCIEDGEQGLKILSEPSMDVPSAESGLKVETEEENTAPSAVPPIQRKKRKWQITVNPRKSLKVHTCDTCPAVFSRVSQLKYHTKIHLDNQREVYECDECKVVFSQMAKLVKHKERKHSQTLKCTKCDAQFTQSSRFRLHMRVHSGERPYCCNECGASFIQSSHLSIHKRSHTGEKPYQCDVCKQAFKQISHLRSHERIHTQTKPYSCEHCDKHFIQKSSLNRHRRIHTGEKPYVCALCSAAFCVKSNLDRHVVIHTGYQPFTCELCGAAFGQSVDLKRHKMSHFGIKPFRCEECHACFSRNNNLMWHKNTHTGETPLKCDQCSCKFMRPRDLKKHKMSHAPSKAHSCPVCQQSFLQLTSLKKHMELHTGEKAFSCKECLTTFNVKSSLKRHMSKHSDSKPFECADCGSQFREFKSLKRHSFQVHGKKLEIKPQPKCSDTNQVINQVQDNVAASQQSGANDSNNHVPHQYMTYQVQMQDPSLSSAIQCNMYNGQESQPPAISYTSAPLVLSSIQPIVQTQMSTLMISAGPGQPMRTAKAANNCQNHSAHVITMASNNQWQTWCFCEVPNIPPAPLSVNILEGSTIPHEVTPDFAHALQRQLQADQMVNENNLHVLESSVPTLGSGGQPLVLRSANGAPQAIDAKLSSNLQFHVIGEGPSSAQPVWVNGNWIQHK